MGYLDSKIKAECTGCEACIQVCAKKAIKMVEDKEGFRYPEINSDQCINCTLCFKTCPYDQPALKSQDKKLIYGGYIKDEGIRGQSTSGGVFSAIVDSWCDENYAIFGAVADSLKVRHTFITDKSDLGKLRKSKYLQSEIKDSFIQAKKMLEEGKKVLFSGTPCQIAGLKKVLKNSNQDNLLTIEVICEGVPSPHYMNKYNTWITKKYKSSIKTIDYRYKNGRKWDFEAMSIVLNDNRQIKQDRWFNSFWSIWLQHLMSRPSCYKCPYTTEERVADITLGDLWGVHIYCPELYGHNSGSSLILCNTEKGKTAFNMSKGIIHGHELKFEDAIKYQAPLRKPIDMNDDREFFMTDLLNEKISYKEICNKWAKPPTLGLLASKYIWGNRQKVWLWNIKNKLNKKH